MTAKTAVALIVWLVASIVVAALALHPSIFYSGLYDLLCAACAVPAVVLTGLRLPARVLIAVAMFGASIFMVWIARLGYFGL